MSSFNNRFLEEKVIGFSIANNQDLSRKGFGEEHLKDVSMEFGRYLLNSGGQLAFGHDIRSGGYGELFAELNQYYTPINTDRKRCINFLAWPIASKLKQTDFFELADMRVDAQPFNCPKVMLEEKPENPKTYFFPEKEAMDQETVAAKTNRRYHWALCLTEMRQKMIEETHANLFIGGKLTGFSGVLPGTLEEARLASEKGNPIYLMGAFGGLVHVIASALQGENPKELRIDYHESAMPGYKQAYDKYLGALELSGDLFAEHIAYFKNMGLDGLGKLNGLNIDDNLRLFETPHIPEMVRLVLKGLNNIWPSKGSAVPG